MLNEIEVGLEPSLMMNEIAVTSFRSINFLGNHVPRGTVKGLKRERVDEGVDFVWGKPENNVDIVGEAWLSVVNGSNTTTDHVTNPMFAEGISEEKEWLSLRHW